MRISYENDTEIKIPKWYLKLSQKTINRIRNAGLVIQRGIYSNKRKTSTLNKASKNIKFYL